MPGSVARPVCCRYPTTNGRGRSRSPTSGFGQGIAVTARADGDCLCDNREPRPANAAGNHKPDRECRRKRQSRSFQARPVTRAVCESAADELTKMLRGCVEQGTGKPARIDGRTVAGKTGSAQMPRSDGRGYEKGAYIASFMGFAPATNPRISISGGGYASEELALGSDRRGARFQGDRRKDFVVPKGARRRSCQDRRQAQTERRQKERGVGFQFWDGGSTGDRELGRTRLPPRSQQSSRSPSFGRTSCLGCSASSGSGMVWRRAGGRSCRNCLSPVCGVVSSQCRIMGESCVAWHNPLFFRVRPKTRCFGKPFSRNGRGISVGMHSQWKFACPQPR